MILHDVVDVQFFKKEKKINFPNVPDPFLPASRKPEREARDSNAQRPKLITS